MSIAHRSASNQMPSVWLNVLALALRDLHCGELSVTMPNGRVHRFTGAAPGPSASITVRDRVMARRIILGTDLGLAESYMDGQWDTDDLDAVLRLGMANLADGWISELPTVTRPLARVRHLLRDNDSRGGSKRNIEYHYDLGNDFYQLWLDDTLTYSAALLDEPESDTGGVDVAELEDGQRRKWDRILELVDPGAGDRILEIGCGWGGFALHAAREAGCRVTGLTLSERQAVFARERVRQAGLDGQIDIRLQDYREVPETYDGIASIEMFEAVGEKWWPVFFGQMKSLLKPGAAAGLQVITIAEDSFETYRREPDFIQRYIFPGGMLPSFERFRDQAVQCGLSVGLPHFFGRHYACTLASWAERFEASVAEIRALGFDERFIRMWRYYLAYCKAGFENGNIDVMQVRLEA